MEFSDYPVGSLTLLKKYSRGIRVSHISTIIEFHSDSISQKNIWCRAWWPQQKQKSLKVPAKICPLCLPQVTTSFICTFFEVGLYNSVDLMNSSASYKNQQKYSGLTKAA